MALTALARLSAETRSRMARIAIAALVGCVTLASAGSVSADTTPTQSPYTFVARPDVKVAFVSKQTYVQTSNTNVDYTFAISNSGAKDAQPVTFSVTISYRTGSGQPAGSHSYSETYSIVRRGDTYYAVVHCRPAAFSYCAGVTVSVSTPDDANLYNNSATAS